MTSNDRPWRNCPIDSKLSTKALSCYKATSRRRVEVENHRLEMSTYSCENLDEYWGHSGSMWCHIMRNRTGVDLQTLREINQRQDCSTTSILVQIWTLELIQTRTWMLWCAGRNKFKTTFAMNATSEFKTVGLHRMTYNKECCLCISNTEFH